LHHPRKCEVNIRASDNAKTSISENFLNVWILRRQNILKQDFCLLWQFFSSQFQGASRAVLFQLAFIQ